jgi:choline dehydrogenase-like flavoprotein
VRRLQIPECGPHETSCAGREGKLTRMPQNDFTEPTGGHKIDADVCIVGGGPAGITVAMQLLGTDLSVVILESGGLDEQGDSRALNEGTNTGLPYYELDETRYRGFGGASNLWAGWCRPLSVKDFDSRPWVTTPSWPISYDEVAPYYEDAARICELPDSDFTASDDLPAVYKAPFIGNGVDVAVWKGSPPTKFGRVYRTALEDAPNVTIIPNATAVEVRTNNDGSVATGLRVVRDNGVNMEVSASSVVLCAGAIETARLLLASRSVKPHGLGNDHDLVGRHFMEHPHLVTARLDVLSPEVTKRQLIAGIDRGLLGTQSRLAMQRPKGSAKVAYVISDERRERDQLLNFSTHIRTVSKVDREDSEAYQAFKLVVNNLRSPTDLARQVASGAMPEGASEQLSRLGRGLPEIAQVVYQEALKRPTELALYTQSEQVPNPDSRVTIDDNDRDAVGMPRVRLHWALSRMDKESVIGAHEVLAEQFATSGLGVLIPEPAFLNADSDWGTGLRGGHHHMGTARMADSPRDGVVDRRGRVHNVEGLYIGDSAVFSTSGFANPLLTIVALATRLGKHLAAVQTRPAASATRPARTSTAAS